LLFCEFRSNLTRTTSHDWHVQPFVKDPRETRTGRPPRIVTTRILRFEPSSSKPFKHTTQFPVLSTRVSQWIPGEHRTQIRGNVRSRFAFLTHFAHKALESGNSLKILFWRFCDSARPCRGSLSPTSSPVAGAAILKRYLLDAQRDRKFQNRSALQQRQQRFLADSLFISNRGGRRKGRLATLARISPPGGRKGA